MRQLFVAAAFAAFVVLTGWAQAGKVEVKGPHICCKQCVTIAKGILAKVDGVIRRQRRQQGQDHDLHGQGRQGRRGRRQGPV